MVRFMGSMDEKFIRQREDENRSMEQTLDLGWRLLSTLPREELDRIDDKLLDQYYKPEEAVF